MNNMKKSLILLFLLLPANLFARGVQEFVTTSYSTGDVKLVWKDFVADVYVSQAETSAVRNAATIFTEDVERITGHKPSLRNSLTGLSSHVVIVGTLDKSQVIKDLIAAGKIDVSEVQGKWETFLIQVVPKPLPGVETGLVIAGSDRRGTMYGIFDVSENMGVSPWYWFADVHPQKQTALVVKDGTYREGPPSVKYRGIFINDEMWGIRPWAKKTYAPDEGQGLGPKTYRRIFELLLRLKANHIWPAMHRGTIPFNYYDDNKVVADEYAIVMGTSHIEPMLRNNIGGAEWDQEYPGEPWDYVVNKDHIYKYWEDRVKTNRMYENVYTIGKRGKDDAAGSDVTVSVLEDIFADQRKILSSWVNPDPTKVPQVLIAYTEVLGLYNQGLQVPDDVIICWPDDNWGYIRQLPNSKEQQRWGGSGIYYHFQWLQGASACYVWLHTTPLGLTWQQMHMAYEYNVRDLWVVNVGDIKPHEIGTEYFMRLGWDIRPWTSRNTRKFLLEWATRDFGARYAARIADIMEKHFELGYARRPESMVQKAPGNTIKWDWFNLDNHNDEVQQRIDAYDELISQVDDVYAELPKDLKDAFFQMVLYNVKGSGLHNKKVLYAQKSNAYGGQKRASAAYNRCLVTVGAKWSHMASMPGPYGGMGRQFDMPPLSDYKGVGPASLNIALEGGIANSLADFSVYTKNKRFIDLFNSGTGTIRWSADVSDEWVQLSERSGLFEKEQRIWISIDWTKAPKGTQQKARVVIKGTGKTLNVRVLAFNPAVPMSDEVKGFVESHGYASIEAEHYSRKVDKGGARWDIVAGLGRTGNSMTVLPPTVSAVTGSDIVSSSPVLEYDVYLFTTGIVTITLYSSPTRPINGNYGLRYAVSFDEGTPTQISGGSANAIDNVRKMQKQFTISKAGQHVLKVWMIDPGMVLDKIVIDTSGVAETYLGPPESFANQEQPAVDLLGEIYSVRGDKANGRKWLKKAVGCRKEILDPKVKEAEGKIRGFEQESSRAVEP
jgi:hypothetical protein